MHDTSDGLPNHQPLPSAVPRQTEGHLPESKRTCAESSAAPEEMGDCARSFGDYELLEVIGRGRTGMVFRASHAKLKRQVALKVMRAAPFVLPEEGERFRLEAELSARLDHPNIVPLYEVGEHRGQPYFTMKLIEGGSLAEHVADFANSIPAAARLVAVVARAIHHAHQHAILHRDLKPANILLEWHDEAPAAPDQPGSAKVIHSLDRCQPWVIDLGLARRLDGAASLTESGAVLGTPSYLAPEQAASAQAVTVAADVYGLGAILYELLTGRPPFRGETDLETLCQVCDQQPVRPRALNPRIDRDLERVCLKCLEKEPRHRYRSAQDLAEDLERWRRGEPVRARPVGPVSRLVKWARRQPAVARRLALCVLLMAAGLATFLWREAEVRARLDEELYAEALGQVEKYLAEDETKQAEEVLDACPRSARGWEWHCLKRLCHKPPLTRSGKHARMMAEMPPVSPDGKYVAELGGPWRFLTERENTNWVKVSARDSGREVYRIESAPWYPIRHYVFTPDSRRIITIERFVTKVRVRAWDARDGRALVTLGTWATLPVAPAANAEDWDRLEMSPLGDSLVVRLSPHTQSEEVWDAAPVREWLDATTLCWLAMGGVLAALGIMVPLRNRYRMMAGIRETSAIMTMLLLPKLLLKGVEHRKFNKAECDRLIQELNDWRPRVRWKAAKSLGEMGPQARDAMSSLKRLLVDEDLWVRRQAEEAARKITGRS